MGQVTHHYRANNEDILTEQTAVFDVQVYEDGVVTMPAKPNSGENGLQLINI